MLKSLLNTKISIYSLANLAVAILIIIFIVIYQNTINKKFSLINTTTSMETANSEISVADTNQIFIADTSSTSTNDVILENKDIERAQENLNDKENLSNASSSEITNPNSSDIFVPTTNSDSSVQIIETPAPELPTSITQKEIMAWIYPGATVCNVKAEYSDGRKIDILKPEYFTINEDGKLVLLTVENRGCNGYSPANVESVRGYSKEQYATISSSYAGSMDLFLTESLENSTNIDTLVAFTVDNKITGLEIDFEDFGGWSASSYQKYKEFITKLGNALHAKNKKLMIDGPATSNAVEEAWYVWRYSDFNNLPIDKLVIMLYDYQYDHGAGQPVAPITWIQETIKFTLGKFPNKAKLSIGVPSYGYKGPTGANRFSLLTYSQIEKEPGFANAKRDPNSFEMTWEEAGNTYFYQDSESLVKKIQTIKNLGIDSISIWHLGGNLWF